MLRFVLTVLLAILTLALFVRLVTTSRPFRAAVLLIVAGFVLAWLWTHNPRPSYWQVDPIPTEGLRR
ncbi:conserved protein of unknown function [Rhodovastum atsumiense]|uniref:Uncharacterized protein n=1 Tax=Rhodovastum atsumiense TaxID=504468 RepID=A0A5M6IJC4_9PROT|nr:hypothetical protein [Rhodovastum atsumiense]KAA5608252.1 hypothetical protein F1189_29970 [Rhodovastum atsumiense]CAH2603435.1 conserved protein of unknown function [Rhodovastum atsumiense]